MTEPPRHADPTRCMKCGFCMSVCPVYGVDQCESHVARGRNVLIQKQSNGSVPLSDGYREVLSLCLLCKRCEAVCPARLSPMQITQVARTQVLEKNGRTFLQRLVNKLLLNHRSILARSVGLIGLLPGFASSGKKPLRHLMDTAKIFSTSFRWPSLSNPTLAQRIHRVTRKKGTQIPPEERIAFFPGCIYEFFQADIAQDMVTAMADAGFEIIYPDGLSCCGLAMHSAGDTATAQQMAMKNIQALSQYSKIVTGCATCGSALKAYGSWFASKSKYHAMAKSVSDRVFDFSELLADRFGNSLKHTHSFTRETVTFHDPCHLKQHQGVSEAPRRILKSLPGVAFVEMENADACCGLGGSFGISHADISHALQDKKVAAILKSGAQTVVTSCPGCQMFLADGLSRHNVPVRVMHIAELMARQRP